jgi:hypothetical protein
MEFCAATRLFPKQIELYFENMKVHTTDRLYFVRMQPPHELFALRDKVMDGASKIHTRNLSREAHLGELGEARTGLIGLPLARAHFTGSLPVFQGKAPDARIAAVPENGCSRR